MLTLPHRLSDAVSKVMHVADGRIYKMSVLATICASPNPGRYGNWPSARNTACTSWGSAVTTWPERHPGEHFLSVDGAVLVDPLSDDLTHLVYAAVPRPLEGGAE